MRDWTDRELIEEMNFIDSEGYTKPLNIKWHCSRWYALASILAERYGANWQDVVGTTA